MAQIVEFNGFTFKINPENRKELLIKRTTAKNFTSFKSFEATIHYLLSSKNQHFAKNLKPQSFQNQGIALFFLYFSQVRGLSRTLK